MLLYYYKDEEHQDPVVKVSAMKRMFAQVATAANMKKEVAIPNGGGHVLGSYIKSKDLVTVEAAIDEFAQRFQLQLKGLTGISLFHFQYLLRKIINGGFHRYQIL